MRLNVRGRIGSLVLGIVLVFAVGNALAVNDLRYSIVVSEFENKSNWSGQWHLGEAFGAVLVDSLNQTGRFIVLGEQSMRKDALNEQDFASSSRAAGGGKKVVTGQMTPAQLIIKGEITHFEPGTSGGGAGVGFGGFKVGLKGGTAEINTVMYIVDASTGQVVASKKCFGKMTQQGLSLGIDKGGFSGDVGGFKKTNAGKAVEMAVDEGVRFLIGQLDDIPWSGTVILTKKDMVYINRGEREGIGVGQVFDVGVAEILRDPDTGEVLDQSMETAGTIEVIKVKQKIAICKITRGGDIEKGMAVVLPE